MIRLLARLVMLWAALEREVADLRRLRMERMVVEVFGPFRLPSRLHWEAVGEPAEWPKP